MSAVTLAPALVTALALLTALALFTALVSEDRTAERLFVERSADLPYYLPIYRIIYTGEICVGAIR